MKVKSRMSCPVRRKDGTWTTVIKEFEEDIPDLGREELICNKCGLIIRNARKRFAKPGNTTNRKNNILCKSLGYNIGSYFT